MGNGKSVPLDTDPRCETLAPIWGPFVDAFVDTLHAKGGAVHPPPPRELRRGGSRGRRGETIGGGARPSIAGLAGFGVSSSR